MNVEFTHLASCCRVGDGFATAAQAALQEASGSTPCLRIVPRALAAKHHETLLALGVGVRFVALLLRI